MNHYRKATLTFATLLAVIIAAALLLSGRC
jgi:hypothetical protein